MLRFSILLINMLPGAAFAENLDCIAAEHCYIETQTCKPSAVQLNIRSGSGVRHAITLEGRKTEEADALMMSGGLTFLFGEGDITHQVQIKSDNSFTYRLDVADPTAPGGFAGDVWFGTCTPQGGGS